ncbi:MAG: DUF4012 domain-containing protein, partial [bacterium]|nr:DUF4012 domain-containing protein [bacterium]
MPKKNILRQLFDIRPVDYRGNLDWEKIFKARRIVNFVHLVEGYERSFTPRRMKLFVNDRRGRELFKHYLQIKKFHISRPESEEFAVGLVANLTRPPEIVFEYRPQIVENPEVFPSREELLNQLENICRIDFAVESLFSQKPSPEKFSAPSDKFESRGWFSKLKSRSKALKINRFTLAASILVLSIFLISSFLFSNFIEEKASRTLKTADYLKTRENILKSRDLLAMVDFYQDSRTFESFERGLIVSKQKIDKISRALFDILENTSSSDARAVSSLVELTKLFNQTSESFSLAIEFYSGKNFFALLAGEEPKPETLTSLLGKSNQNFEQVLASLDEIKSKLEKIDRGFLPADAADEILNLGDKTSALASSVKNFLESNRFLLKFLGGDGSKRFLIVFQNPVNLRPTGGSVSGYAIVGVDRGILTDLFFEDAFNVDNYKLRERVIPPRPLQRLNLNWGMSDANWFFDFSISAQKLIWFSEKAGSPKIDYVVALSPRFFEDLLKITGSVNLADAKKIVNAENFREILTGRSNNFDPGSSQFVRIMSEFFPKFLQKLTELERIASFKALDLINKNLEEKNILIHAAELEEYLKKTGWAGEVKKEKGNYLAVVDSVINS